MVKSYIFTTAQNYTNVDPKALAVLKTYATQHKAKIHVLPLVYNTKEKHLFGYDNKHDAPEFDPRIEEYLTFGNMDLNDNLIVMPLVHTRPTTKDQLSGLLTISKDKSAIFAGARHRSLSVATPGHKLPKILYTTPTITVPKYSPSSSGTACRALHEIGAVIVEVQNKKVFHIRQLTINDQYEIHDLGYKYRAGKKPIKARPLGLIVGDLHQMWSDPDAVKATFTGKDSMIKKLHPQSVVIHDFIDFYAANHHHVGDRLLEYMKQKYGLNRIHEELIQAMKFIHEVTPKGVTAYIVASNHCDALDRWLNSGRGDSDPVNAPLYHLLNYCRYTNADMNGPEAFTTNPIEDFANHFCPETLERVEFLRRGEYLHIGGHECNYHGDRGPSGSRGSLKGLSNLGVPVLIGHGHGPQRDNNNGQVGTLSRLNMGYNSGEPSNWMHSNAIINEDSTWSLLNIIGGVWHG